MAISEEKNAKKIIGITHEGWIEFNEEEGIKRYNESQGLTDEGDDGE